jgi:sugar phosphate isomerase/epimerase
VYVACSTLCFGTVPLAQALRTIGELHFGKLDVALHDGGPHLTPAEVAADVSAAAQRLRGGLNLCVAALHVSIDAEKPAEFAGRLRAVCRLARVLAVPLVCLPAAPAGGDFEAEVARLAELNRLVSTEGVILTVETHSQTMTADPAGAAELCRRVPGLGLTLDPSHYLAGPHARGGFDAVYPHVRHVRLRDTGGKAGEFQVRVGQGQVEYGRIITQLARHGYNRVLTVDIRDQPTPEFPVVPELRKLKYLLESLV